MADAASTILCRFVCVVVSTSPHLVTGSTKLDAVSCTEADEIVGG
ncbi:hypothetical protein G155_00247 [Mycobacterium sp. VKM Ac-1817D]|nr:hypothetical protein G155_00247 [Mycobacterium sp. VKM Ac-1817D]